MGIQKFQRRTTLVTPREMEKYWKHLNLNYMTEESDDPENPNGIVEHRLTWRSQSMECVHVFTVLFIVPFYRVG